VSPRGAPGTVARRHRWNDHHAWRARLEFPDLKSIRTARLDCCDLPDGLRRLICNQPRADLLALDRGDLSATNSWSRRRHSGHVQLGFEPNRLAYLPDIGRETRRELNVSALRIFLGDVLALRLLSRSGDQRAHSGRDRSILENGPVVSKNGGPNFLAQSLAIVRFRQIKYGAEGNNARWVNVRMRHVIMALDVIEINGVGDARLLIQIHQVALQIWIVDDTPQIALEMAVIDDVEANKGAKKSPVRLDDSIR